MKKLLLSLLILPFVLFAQDNPFSEPEHNTPTTDELTFKYDGRCTAPMQWSASLVQARQSGTTVEQVVSSMAYEYQNGSLRGISDATLQYLLHIVAIVFTHESVETKEDVVAILQEVEKVCVEFIEAQEKAKNPEIST